MQNKGVLDTLVKSGAKESDRFKVIGLMEIGNSIEEMKQVLENKLTDNQLVLDKFTQLEISVADLQNELNTINNSILSIENDVTQLNSEINQLPEYINDTLITNNGNWHVISILNLGIDKSYYVVSTVTAKDVVNNKYCFFKLNGIIINDNGVNSIIDDKIDIKLSNSRCDVRLNTNSNIVTIECRSRRSDEYVWKNRYSINEF